MRQERGLGEIRGRERMSRGRERGYEGRLDSET